MSPKVVRITTCGRESAAPAELWANAADEKSRVLINSWIQADARLYDITIPLHALQDKLLSLW